MTDEETALRADLAAATATAAEEALNGLREAPLVMRPATATP